MKNWKYINGAEVGNMKQEPTYWIFGLDEYKKIQELERQYEGTYVNSKGEHFKVVVETRPDMGGYRVTLVTKHIDKNAPASISSRLPSDFKKVGNSVSENSWEPMQAKKYYEEAKKSGDNKKIDEIKKAIDAEYYAAYKAYDELKQRQNDLQVNQDRPGRVPNLEKARSKYELWKIVKSAVGNSWDRAYYKQMIDPAKWDEFSKKFEKLAYAQDLERYDIEDRMKLKPELRSEKYKIIERQRRDMESLINKYKKIGNETMHEWATSKPKNVGNYSKGQSLGESGGRKYVYGGEINGTHIVYEQPGGTSYTFSSEQEIKDWLRASHIGNSKVINSDREFFKELADDAKEREKKDDAEIEKIGNKTYKVKESSGHDGGYDYGYIVVDESNRSVGRTFSTRSEAEEYIRELYKKEKVGNSSKEDTISHLDTDLYEVHQKLKSRGANAWAYLSELNRMGWSMDTLSKYSREIGKIVEKYKAQNSKCGNSASDDKFAYVMREFDEGKLKTPDGKVVTDPAQAKAIAYSESKKTENGLARARNAMAGNKKVKNSAVREYKHSDGRVAQIDFNEDGSDADMSIYEGTKEIEQRNFSTIRDAEQYVTSHGFRRI